MALEKLNLSDFDRWTQEIGVAPELAKAFLSIESGMGENADAYIHPAERSLILKRNPGAIGYGPLQIIRGTFNGINPGADYDNATTEELTKAGLTLLKTLSNEDGTYDLKKVAQGYFGSGSDRAFKIDANGNVVKRLGTDNGPGESDYYPSKVRLTELIDLTNQFKETPRQATTYKDVYNQVRDTQLHLFQSAANKEVAQNNAILNQYKVNPDGANAMLAQSADLLTAMNAKIAKYMQWRDMTGPTESTNPVGKFLETAAKGMIANRQLPRAIGEAKFLAQQIQEINRAIDGSIKVSSTNQIGLADTLRMQAESRQAAIADVGTDIKQVGMELQRERLALAEDAAESRKRIAEANLTLKTMKTEKDRADAINIAIKAEAVDSGQDPNLLQEVSSPQDFNALYGHDKEFTARVLARVTGNVIPSVERLWNKTRNPGASAEVAQYARNLASLIEDSIKTNVRQNPLATPKQLESMGINLIQAEIAAGGDTSNWNVRINPQTLPEAIALNGIELAQTLQSNGINIKDISNDSQLLARVSRLISNGNITRERAETELQRFYSTYAEHRSKIHKELGFSSPPDRFKVKDSKGNIMDLTKQSFITAQVDRGISLTDKIGQAITDGLKLGVGF